MDGRVPSGRRRIGDHRPRPTNAIVVKDERCSRNHAEVFQAQGQWTLRDLDSRNGTLVDGQRIQVDYQLQAGRHRPHRQFAPGVCSRSVAGVSRFALGAAHGASRSSVEDDGDPTVGPTDNESVLETYEPTTITHRRGRAAFWNRRKRKMLMSRCRRSAAPRRTCAGWRSSWPRRPTW